MRSQSCRVLAIIAVASALVWSRGGTVYADIACQIIPHPTPNRRTDCHNSVMPGVILPNVNLSGANLEHIYWPDAVLTNARLIDTNLHFADLHGAHLQGAFIAHANLHFAILRDADLSDDAPRPDLRGETNVIQSDLGLADLHGANLSNIKVTQSDLRNANLQGAILRGARLSEVLLDNVHWGNTICPDGTNSNNNGGTCLGHLTPH